MRRTSWILALLLVACGGCKLKPKGGADGGSPGSQNTGDGGGQTGVQNIPTSGEACRATTSKASGECALAAGPGLPGPRTAAPSVTIGSKLVIVGGQSSAAGFTGDAIAAVVGADGTVGGWQTAALPTNHPNAAVAAVGGSVYVVGGEVQGDTTGSTDVFVGHVGDDASLAFSATMPLPTGLTKVAAAGGAGRFYVVGGRVTGGSNDMNTVLVATVDGEGNVTGYTRTTDLPEGRSSAQAAVVGGRLYVVGGHFKDNATSCAAHQVIFAPINADGSLGSWTATTSLGSPPIGALLVPGSNRLYLVGGTATYGDTKNGASVGSVVAADVKSDGSLGAWSRVGAMPDLRYGHAAALIGGRLFVLGGLVSTDNGPVVQQDGYVATVKDDGSLSCP